MTIDVAFLAQRIPEQRWFGGKGRALDRVEVVDSARLTEGPPWLTLAIVRVRHVDGGADLYHVPLIVEEDGSSRDAFDDVGWMASIGRLMATGASIDGEKGVFRFGGPGLDPMSPPGKNIVRALGAEQTNTSLVFDEEIIVKVFRRLDVGANPDLELTRLLTNEGFEHIPAQVGEVRYEHESGGEIDLCLAQHFERDSVDGWSEACKDVQRFYDGVHPEDAREDMRFLTEERSADMLRAIDELGEVTASLHVTLSREELDPDVAPEDVEHFDLMRWAKAAEDSLDDLLDKGADELAADADEIRRRITAVTRIEDAGRKIRTHADYHLGQVLLTRRGWMILDFEGEPARTLEERRAKHSPLRDVAGMLRSFDYAATAGLFERAEPNTPEWDRLEAWGRTWDELARERFLHAYLTRSHEGTFLPADRDNLAALLDFFELEKALYEVGYERGHRPTWARIPLNGIRRILRKEERR